MVAASSRVKGAVVLRRGAMRVAAWAAVVILHEPFGWPHMIAMALTILGVWLLAKPRLTRTAGARTW